MTDSLLLPDDEPATAAYLGDPTVVARFGSVDQALTLKGCLVAAGLPATIGDQHLMMQGGGWLGGSGNGVRVLVPATLVARANEVIAEFRAGAFEIEGDDDPELAPAAKATDLAFWGPDLSAFLSLFLTPIFGTAIHWLNSRTLGERRLARIADAWLLLSFAAAAVGFWLLRERPWGLGSAFGASGVVAVFTATWYFFGAHAQSRFIMQSFGRQYRPRPLLPLAAGTFAAMIAIGAIGQSLGLD